jgi:hypothetical protein
MLRVEVEVEVLRTCDLRMNGHNLIGNSKLIAVIVILHAFRCLPLVLVKNSAYLI